MDINQVRQAVSATRYVTVVDVVRRMGLAVTKHNVVTVRTHLDTLASSGAVDTMGNGYMIHTHREVVLDDREWSAPLAECPTREAVVMWCRACDSTRPLTDAEFATWSGV